MKKRIAEIIRQAHKDSGLSMNSLERRSGVSKTIIYKILAEKGYAIDSLDRLLDTMKIDIFNHKEVLCEFFKFFRDNGEANIGMTIEEFVESFESFLSQN
jgi:transcriptional regulator with XRE-family HTH domain